MTEFLAVIKDAGVHPLVIITFMGVVIKLVINGTKRDIAAIKASVDKIDTKFDKLHCVNHAERIAKMEGAQRMEVQS